MNISNLKFIFLNFLSVLMLIFGVFLLTRGILNPVKIVIENLTDDDFKNKYYF